MSFKDLQKSITKEFGEEVIIKELESVSILNSFGSLAVDCAVGLGGIPKGRIIEFYGNPSGGKTALAIIAIIECQKNKKPCVFIDLENSFDPAWFRKLGGNVDEDLFLLLHPKSGADAYEMMDRCVQESSTGLIVIDSVSAMATDAELEAGYADSTMAQLARLMSSGLKKINNQMLRNPGPTLIFINQVRATMDKYHPEATSGGNALGFYSSIRLNIRRVGGKDGIIGDPDRPSGFKTRITVIKNKVGIPKQTIETNLYIGTTGKFGIDKSEEIIDVAKSLGLIKRLTKNKDTNELVIDPDGSYYQIDGYEPIYGQNKFELFIAEKSEIKDQLLKQIEIFTKKNNEPESDSFAAEVKEEEKKQRKSRKNKDEEN